MFARNATIQMLQLLCVSWVTLWAVSNCTFGQETADRTTASGAQPAKIRYVNSSQAQLFAGPGEDFYPTGVLKSGQSIEVRQETDDGWLAITPPAGSFSWLPASQGLLLPGGRIVEVTEKSAVSWIGTALGTAKQYRWQVKLERGQQLAVIGEQTINDPASGSKALWYKITPPNGEYRWIQDKATADQRPPVTPSSETSNPENSEVEVASTDSEENDSRVVQASTGEPTQAISKQQARSSARHNKPHQHTDRWADWHAIEFKNGTFSFPGMARMLGIPPAQPTNAGATGDPFDLTASYARGNPSKLNLSHSATGASPIDPTDVATSGAATSTGTVRQSRGWRDPRQLRHERINGSFDEGHQEGTALAADEANFDDADAEVMDASFQAGSEVGTSVVAAGATETQSTNARRPRNTMRTADTNGDSLRDQAWYGIEQAPASKLSNHMASSSSIAQASLEEVQLELSTMVAGPEHAWNLAPLAERARYFIEHGQDSLQRGQARLLLERIESFAQIAWHPNVPPLSTPQASNALRSIPATTASTTLSSAPINAASWVAPQSNNPNSTTDETTGPRFDSTGWLVPVHSSGRDMPTHALTNDAGRIIVYVTPAPGVNLTRFESQAIGVYGLRGYLPQLKTNHIQIQRVVRLQ